MTQCRFHLLPLKSPHQKKRLKSAIQQLSSQQNIIAMCHNGWSRCTLTLFNLQFLQQPDSPKSCSPARKVGGRTNNNQTLKFYLHLPISSIEIRIVKEIVTSNLHWRRWTRLLRLPATSPLDLYCSTTNAKLAICTARRRTESEQ